MIQLTTRQRETLNKIMDNKYACGPFIGMITNLTLDRQAKGIATTPEQVLKQALQIRVIVEDTAIHSERIVDVPEGTAKEENKEDHFPAGYDGFGTLCADDITKVSSWNVIPIAKDNQDDELDGF